MPPVSDASNEDRELSKILTEMRNFAGDLIGSTGALPPFAVALGADGTPALIYLQPRSNEVVTDHLNRLFAEVHRQARAEHFRGAGIAYMVSLNVESKATSAMRAIVQHRLGTPREITVPFNRTGDHVEFGGPLTRPAQHAIF